MCNIQISLTLSDYRLPVVPFSSVLCKKLDSARKTLYTDHMHCHITHSKEILLFIYGLERPLAEMCLWLQVRFNSVLNAPWAPSLLHFYVDNHCADIILKTHESSRFKRWCKCRILNNGLCSNQKWTVEDWKNVPWPLNPHMSLFWTHCSLRFLSLADKNGHWCGILLLYPIYLNIQLAVHFWDAFLLTTAKISHLNS